MLNNSLKLEIRKYLIVNNQLKTCKHTASVLNFHFPRRIMQTIALGFLCDFLFVRYICKQHNYIRYLLSICTICYA